MTSTLQAPPSSDLKSLGSSAVPKGATRTRQQNVPPRTATALDVPPEASARSRHFQPKRDYSSVSGQILADWKLPRSQLPSSKLLSGFLEYGVCREQYFTEVSLRGELATEARLVAEVLAEQSSRTYVKQPTPESSEEAYDSSTEADAKTATSFEAEASSPARTELPPSISPPQPSLVSSSPHKSAKRRRRSSLRKDLSTVDARRKARRHKWQHFVEAGAVVGVEAGALELASKRKLDLSRHLRKTGSVEPTVEVQWAPKLWNREQGVLDSALDLLLGQQGAVLSRHEELQLVKEMQGGLAICQAIEQLQGETDNALSPEELEERLGMPLSRASDCLERGLRAKTALLHANKRLVFKLAHKFGFDQRVPFEEYVLAGMEGLVKGLLKFDPCRGHKLSSLLVWWIRASVSTLATTLNNIVHVPKKLQYSTHAMAKTRRRLTGQLRRTPTEAELCRATELSPRELQQLVALQGRVTLQTQDCITQEEEGGIGREEQLQADEGDTPGSMLAQNSLEEYLEQQLCKLPGREARILRSLYGLHSPYSLARLQKEVAVELGVTPRRVSQIRQQILQHLREAHLDTLQEAVTLF